MINLKEGTSRDGYATTYGSIKKYSADAEERKTEKWVNTKTIGTHE